MNMKQPITHKDQLIDYFAQGCKTSDNLYIGTEYEQFVYSAADLRRAPYEGAYGIKQVLTELQDFGWQPVFEKQYLIALKRGDATVTLEPSGQIELSGAKQVSIHGLNKELQEYKAELDKVGDKLGLRYLPMGFEPKWPISELPWMPKQRYQIMRKSLPILDGLGIDMMTSTASVQVNLDYVSEADMVKKLRVSLALQPVATAMFANSPFTNGKINGFQSYRSYVWSTNNLRLSFLCNASNELQGIVW